MMKNGFIALSTSVIVWFIPFDGLTNFFLFLVVVVQATTTRKEKEKLK